MLVNTRTRDSNSDHVPASSLFVKSFHCLLIFVLTGKWRLMGLFINQKEKGWNGSVHCHPLDKILIFNNKNILSFFQRTLMFFFGGYWYRIEQAKPSVCKDLPVSASQMFRLWAWVTILSLFIILVNFIVLLEWILWGGCLFVFGFWDSGHGGTHLYASVQKSSQSIYISCFLNDQKKFKIRYAKWKKITATTPENPLNHVEWLCHHWPHFYYVNKMTQVFTNSISLFGCSVEVRNQLHCSLCWGGVFVVRSTISHRLWKEAIIYVTQARRLSTEMWMIQISCLFSLKFR